MAKKKPAVKLHPSFSRIEEVRELESSLKLDRVMLRSLREQRDLKPLYAERTRIQLEIIARSERIETTKIKETKVQQKMARTKKRLVLLQNKSRIEKLTKLAAEAKEIRKELAALEK